jgi:hypothetical protein
MEAPTRRTGTEATPTRGTAPKGTAICEDPGMAGKFRKLRPTPWALTIALWDIWRRLPPQQQRQVMKLARKHGPKLAAKAAQAATRRRRQP